tara:strand:+ start:1001 stop:1324 length:324 start_codon:yes stop_codon:yes gene_type:complete
MIKKENYEVELDDKNKINIRIIKEHNKLVKFAINLSSYLNGKWHAVYRVDNYHGFLHEQKLWRTKKPIPLTTHEYASLSKVIKYYNYLIKQEYKKFREYFDEKLKNE